MLERHHVCGTFHEASPKKREVVALYELWHASLQRHDYSCTSLLFLIIWTKVVQLACLNIYLLPKNNYNKPTNNGLSALMWSTNNTFIML